MATTTDTALKTFDSVMARFDKKQDEPALHKKESLSASGTMPIRQRKSAECRSA
jgi:hypothetical protein